VQHKKDFSGNQINQHLTTRGRDLARGRLDAREEKKRDLTGCSAHAAKSCESISGLKKDTGKLGPAVRLLNGLNKKWEKKIPCEGMNQEQRELLLDRGEDLGSGLQNPRRERRGKNKEQNEAGLTHREPKLKTASRPKASREQ
jgi:hypothetical protein